MQDKFLIARISAAHGIRGEVKLACFLEDPSTLTHYTPLTTRQGKIYDVRITGTLKDQLIVQLGGVTDRSMAEMLKGTELFADESKLPPAGNNEFYHSELIGMQAVTAGGEAVGKVVAVHNYGAGDIVEIAAADEEIMLPFKSPFVLEVQRERREIIVTLPDYDAER